MIRSYNLFLKAFDLRLNNNQEKMSFCIEKKKSIELYIVVDLQKPFRKQKSMMLENKCL
jgi:hypothetical protein